MTDESTKGPAARGKGRRALGRGLDALIATAPSLPAEGSVREVEIERVVANEEQPRRTFDRSKLEELAASIREHGVVQPLVVAAVGDDRYRIIVGERRWRAAKLAGLDRVPVLVKEASDRQTLELALIENVQRADLDPLEEAAAYGRLMDDYGLTQAQVARQVGKSRVAIANTVRLLALPEGVKRAVAEGRISEGHARALLGVGDQQAQLALLERIERDGLNVRQTEELARRLLHPPTSAPRGSRPPDIEALESDLRRALGTRVSLRQGRKGGKIVIDYFSDEEFQGLYERLTRQS